MFVYSLQPHRTGIESHSRVGVTICKWFTVFRY